MWMVGACLDILGIFLMFGELVSWLENMDGERAG